MKSAKRKLPVQASQTNFGNTMLVVKEVCEYRKPPFLFELHPPKHFLNLESFLH